MKRSERPRWNWGGAIRRSPYTLRNGGGFDVAEKRKAWEEAMGALEIEKPVFPDESAFNVNMTRKYGRAKGKERVKGHVPFSKPKNTTVLSSLRLNGTIRYRSDTIRYPRQRDTARDNPRQRRYSPPR